MTVATPPEIAQSGQSKTLALALAAALSGCAYLAPGPTMPLPVRESLRATPWTWEIRRLPREEENAGDLAEWVSTTTPLDLAANLAVLWAVGVQAARPHGGFHVEGADTQTRWNIDLGIAATQLLMTPVVSYTPVGTAFATRGSTATAPLYMAGSGTATASETLVLRADLHVHSTYSQDSATPLREILLAAQRNRIDVLSVTDHDALAWPALQRTYAEMVSRGEIVRPILLIPGVEISSADGHILAYFVHEPIPPGMDAWSTVAAIHRQGGLAVLAHPHRPKSGISGPLARQVPFDGVERVSGAELFPLAWVADDSNADRVSLRQFASSDAHFAAWVGAAFTEISVTAPTEQAVRDAIMASRLRPVVGNAILGAWDSGLRVNGIRWLALGALWPRFAAHTARTTVARWLRLTDIDVDTSWHDLMLDAYSVWRYKAVLGRLTNPRDPSRLPPLPIRTTVRFRRLQVSLDTPLVDAVGDRSEVEAALRRTGRLRPGWAWTAQRRNVVFIWPADLVGRVEWSYVF